MRANKTVYEMYPEIPKATFQLKNFFNGIEMD